QGGGGCPWVEVKAGDGWYRENTILHRSSEHTIARDGYRLVGSPAIENGRLTIRIREDEQEHSRIDQLAVARVARGSSEATAWLDGRFYAGYLGQPWGLKSIDGQRVAVEQGTAYRGVAGSGLVAMPSSPTPSGGIIKRPVVIRPFVKGNAL